MTFLKSPDSLTHPVYTCKGKIFPVHVSMAYVASRGIAPLILTSPLDGGVLLTSRPGLLYPGEIIPLRIVGPRECLDVLSLASTGNGTRDRPFRRVVAIAITSLPHPCMYET